MGRVNAEPVTERCRAKLNLFLEVLGRRADGYHDLLTVFHTVDLADDLTLAPAPDLRPGEVACRVEGDAASGVPLGDDNLAVRAVRSALAAGALEPPAGLRLRLFKRVAGGAGLGGGSADAAGALRAADRLFGLGLGAGRLERLGAAIGSDVAFLVRGGAALAGGRGERLTDVAAAKALEALIVVPDLHLSTAAVYAALRPDDHGRRDAGPVLAALAADDADAVMASFHNALTAAAFRVAPGLDDLRRRLVERLGRPLVLTGSGAALFTLLAPGTAVTDVSDEPGVREVLRVRLG